MSSEYEDVQGMKIFPVAKDLLQNNFVAAII